MRLAAPGRGSRAGSACRRTRARARAAASGAGSRARPVAAWEWAKALSSPVIGPLRSLGKVLLLLSPVGPALAIYAAWPQLSGPLAGSRPSGVTRTWSCGPELPGEHAAAATERPVGRAGMPSGAAPAGSPGWSPGWAAGVFGNLVGAVGGNRCWRRSARRRPSSRPRRPAGDLGADGGPRGGGRGADALRAGGRLHPAVMGFLAPDRGGRQSVRYPGAAAGRAVEAAAGMPEGADYHLHPDVLIRVVNAIPGNPLLGLLWPFVKEGILGFLTEEVCPSRSSAR